MKRRLASFSIFIFLSASVPAFAKAPIVLWNTLILKDSKNPSDQAKLAALTAKEFRIPGFMMPLETANGKTTKEFLLVPELPACIHVPPPPPSQTVLVKMKDGKGAPVSWEPVWVEGRIKIKTTKTKEFGEASYEMEASDVRILKNEDMNEINKIMGI